MSFLKSVRDRFVAAISRGGPEPEGNPDDVVEAGRVGFSQGPMVVDRLGELGIKANVVESTTVRQLPGHSRVMVLRRDQARAAEFIDRYSREFPAQDSGR